MTNAGEWLLAIDFGTYRTRAAFTSPGHSAPEFVQMPFTNVPWFPSAVVRLPQGGWLLGQDTETNRLAYPDRCWADVKRYLGQDDTPFHVEGQAFSVAEVVAQPLIHAARLARRQAKRGFDRLALAAPVEYQGARLDCLREAGELAGFAPGAISIVTEPQAAAWAALGDRPDDGSWLVFDLGGGTFDAALVRTRNGGVEVLDSVGDKEIGGFAIDAAIAGWLRQKFSLGPFADDEAGRRREICLEIAARELKHGLTTQSEAPAFLFDPPTRLTMKAADLRPLVAPLVDDALGHCEKLLKGGSLDWADVEIVCVGGSTNSPVVLDLVRTRTQATVRACACLPELAVVTGLAIGPRPAPAAPVVPAPTAAAASTAAGPTPSPNVISGGNAKQVKVTRKLDGHSSEVTAVAFSPTGTLLATSSSDNTVRLWDPRTGLHRRTLTGHTGPVWGVAFSPDGTLLATASHDKTVRLWNPATGVQRTVLTGHTGWVWGVAFSPDGTLLATASHDKTVRLWDPAAGTHRRTLTGHEDMVWAAAFSRDGKELVTAAGDNTARLWDPATGRCRTTLAGHTGVVRGAAFALDPAYVATASDDHSARLWAYGSLRRTFSGHTGMVRAVAFSPNGTLLATVGDDKTLRLWQPGNGSNLATLTGHTGAVFAVAFSPDGALLATAGSDNTACVWAVS